jgi:hypothetical protein
MFFAGLMPSNGPMVDAIKQWKPEFKTRSDKGEVDMLLQGELDDDGHALVGREMVEMLREVREWAMENGTDHDARCH